MNRALIIPATIGLAAMVASPSAALANTTRFICDTPSGRGSEFKIPVQATQFQVSGTLQPRLFRAHERWKPTATVALRNAQSGNTMSIRAAANSNEASDAFVTIAINNGEEQRYAVGSLAKETYLGWALTYNRGGMSQFTIGDQSFQFQSDLGTAFDVSFGCSTGEFVFDNLSWQIGTRNVGPPRG